MGCDIHIEVEVFETSSGRWRNVVGAVPETFHTPRFRGSKDWAACVRNPDGPGGRNYYVFSFLAGVRRQDGLPGLFASRDLPQDMDGDPDEESGEDLDLGEHSRTWATLAELLAAPWDIEVPTSGEIEWRYWVEWQERRAMAGEQAWREWPAEWCKDAGGGGIWHQDADHLRTLHDKGAALDAERKTQNRHARLMVRDRWACRPVHNCSFLRWLQSPIMEALREKYGAEGVRVLMGFDS